ncbi:MAG: exo-alpha-sialidase [Blastocatellia bacterium]
MKNGLIAAAGFVMLLVLSMAGGVAAQETAAQKYVIAVERIWDRAPHSAFTDLVDFNGKLYCAFREGSGHVPGREGTNGVIRIIASADGQNWQAVALLTEAHIDLRDPKLSVTPDGRLMVLMGGSRYEGEKLGERRTRVSFSGKTGTGFSAPQPVEIDAKIRTEADWLWRVTWHRGTGYGVVYQSGSAEYKTHLVSTKDGMRYQHVAAFDIADRPNETTLRFTHDGEMIAWARREAGNQRGYIGASRAPYTNWSWQEQPARLGGPNFIVAPGGQLYGVTRGHGEDRKSTTDLAALGRDGALTRLVTFPSGGDTSYAGMVVRGDRLLISYYSSHEGKAAIYLATVSLTALAEAP